MSDITLTTLSGTADAAAMNENLYEEATSSFRAINGYLDTDNKDSSWTVGANQIRNQSAASGRMVGLTGNLDYVSIIFPEENTDSGAYTAVPGCSMAFYLPFDVSLLVLTWTIQGTNNQRMPEESGDDGTVNEFKMFFDNVFLSKQFHAFPSGRSAASSTAAREIWRDRIWSGHAIKGDVSSGFHTLECRLFNSSNTTRIRIRNMKIVYFK